MTLTPAMQRQLQDLYEVQVLQRSSGGRRVHLPTIHALLDTSDETEGEA